MLNQLPGDARHIGWTPCEDVGVVPDEVGEREFLFGVEGGPDDDFLGCVGQAEANLLDSWTWVQIRACTLLLWYLQGSLVDQAAWATMTVAAALITKSLESSTVELSQL
jgi:hypothetical protein